MTRCQKGPNGEQQRVTFERDFKNETELNKFLKDFELNLNKHTNLGGHYRSNTNATFNTNSNSSTPTNKTTTFNEDLTKSPG